MKLRFTKMHGAGNDFVVIDATQNPVHLSHTQVQHIANRYFGVGCDQLLMVESTTTPGVDFRYRIFNADGGEVEQCGNGARCFVRFVVEKGLTTKHDIQVETASGVIRLMVKSRSTWVRHALFHHKSLLKLKQSRPLIFYRCERKLSQSVRFPWAIPTQ